LKRFPGLHFVGCLLLRPSIYTQLLLNFCEIPFIRYQQFIVHLNYYFNKKSMTSTAVGIEQYLEELTEERREAMTKLRNTILKNLPKGFKEVMDYGMIAYVVPHEIYPAGYHCNPKQPLPFIAIASQKNFIALHHLGIYGSPALLKWLVDEYPKHSTTKLDMGKGCIRFKKPGAMPHKLIAELMKKISAKEWINCYEDNIKQRKRRLNLKLSSIR
jgi:hypothetical protein